MDITKVNICHRCGIHTLLFDLEVCVPDAEDSGLVDLSTHVGGELLAGPHNAIVDGILGNLVFVLLRAFFEGIHHLALTSLITSYFNLMALEGDFKSSSSSIVGIATVIPAFAILPYF